MEKDTIDRKGQSKKIFVNLPVKDLDRTMRFFSELGFKFNPKYTDKNAACMIVSDDIYVMLLVEKFFKTFTKKDISDAKRATEVLVALSADDRAEVDKMVEGAIKAGGSEPRKPQDHGWMYGRAFEDLDGHIWEIVHMDEGKAAQSGS